MDSKNLVCLHLQVGASGSGNDAGLITRPLAAQLILHLSGVFGVSVRPGSLG